MSDGISEIGSRSFDEHHGRAITYLRPGVPNRNVTTVAGDGGLGKSLLVLSWSAEVANADGEALIVVAEDGEDVAKLRLRALGAPLERLHFLTIEWGLDERGDPDYDAAAISLPTQAERLDEIVGSYGGRLSLVVIDPWAECLDVSIDSHQAQSLRRAIASLRRIASRHDLVIIVVAHLNKSGQTSLRKRIDGSGALYDGSRSVFLLAPDPDDEAKRVLAHGKFNIGEPLPAREYVIEAMLVPEEGDEPQGQSARIVAGAVSSCTIPELLGATKRDESPKEDEATAFLRFALHDGDWHDSAGVKMLAAAQGISEPTLKRAALELGVEYERRGFPATTYWRLQSAHATVSRLEEPHKSTVGSRVSLGQTREPTGERSLFEDLVAEGIDPREARVIADAQDEENEEAEQ
jgi:KaiC/GvpD/RAD55 family RecA-like ATPase